MLVLVTYDVSTQDDNGKRRLHQVAKQCEKYGQRLGKKYQSKIEHYGVKEAYDPEEVLIL